MANSTGKDGELTGFQEQAPYDESIDLRTDFVMVYGLNDTTPQRIARWREAGYRVHLMTGISWGTYQDYLDGRWDGSGHWDDAQTAGDGSPILHGESTDIPYMVPTFNFTEYLVQKLRPIIELGVEGIHLEEPEFWARAGYSESFKREWQAFFNEPWQPPHSTPEAHFRSGQLKQHLLSRSLDRVTSVLRDEALQHGRQVRFYVPTHSLLNYTQWQIISPESRLRTLPSIDGAIAQVWTGTSRTPNVYAGKVAERTFETAYLEYGIAQDLTRGTDRRMWFLHDPIEDHPDRTWEDYLANWQRTLIASLLHPGVARYEVAPWPNRIFNRPYLREGSTERELIPPDTATSYLIAMNSLRDLDQPDVRWAQEGPRIGIALSDTAMFQRWAPGGESGHYDGLQDALALEGREQLHFSDFYGLALPPLYDGQRVCPVQLENVLDTPDALDDVDVLVLSYEFQKPLAPGIHYALAGWVSRGGACCTSATARTRTTRSAPGGRVGTTPARTIWPKHSAWSASTTAYRRSVRGGCGSFRPVRRTSPNHPSAPLSWSRRSGSWPVTPGNRPTGCRCSAVRTSSAPYWRRAAAHMLSRAPISTCSIRNWVSSGIARLARAS